uniref:Uncharacterized protein n=1 Tax=Rhizophora mucronata TaxID=61149 RepID=A0A2P2QUE3_RHIMU
MAFLCVIFLFLVSSIQSVSGDDTPTVYEVLQEYDFPNGLFHEGVTSYELDHSTSAFTVYFNSTCGFSIDSYELEYKTNVTGYITKDKDF